MATVTTKGLTETLGKVQTAAAGLDNAGRLIVTQSAALIEANAKRNFVGSHSRREPHIGGAKPNVVTGMLRRSITHDPVHSEGPGIWATNVGPTAAYGRRIELGYTGEGSGPGHQTTRPFPFMAPAVENAQNQLRAIALTQMAKVFA